MNEQMQRLSWQQFKDQVAARNSLIQEVKIYSKKNPEEIRTYKLFLYDGQFKAVTFIQADGEMETELNDYLTNYQPNVNKSLEPKDTDGATLRRNKISPLGWMYQMHAIEFTTSKINSFFNQDELGNDLTFVTMKLYDSEDQLITEQTNETNAVKTVIEWEPNHTFEIIAGKFLQTLPPTQDVRLWIIAVPDIPKEYGGDKDFIQGGINLKYFSNVLSADGRVAKKLEYIEGLKLTKIQIVVKHSAGYQHSGQLLFEIFKEN